MNVRKHLALMILMLIVAVSAGTVRAEERAPTPFSETDAQQVAQEWATLVGQGNVPALEKLLIDT